MYVNIKFRFDWLTDMLYSFEIVQKRVKYNTKQKQKNNSFSPWACLYFMSHCSHFKMNWWFIRIVICVYSICNNYVLLLQKCRVQFFELYLLVTEWWRRSTAVRTPLRSWICTRTPSTRWRWPRSGSTRKSRVELLSSEH